MYTVHVCSSLESDWYNLLVSFHIHHIHILQRIKTFQTNIFIKVVKYEHIMSRINKLIGNQCNDVMAEV